MKRRVITMKPRYRFPEYLKHVKQTDDVYTLQIHAFWIPIADDSAMSVAHGLATICCEHWAECGYDTKGMMELHGRDTLAEFGLPFKLFDVMMGVVKTMQGGK